MSTQRFTTKKQGIVTRIEAVVIQCPDCGSVCENQRGSTMIENGDEIVTCTSCQRDYTVPSSAFKVRQPRRSQLEREARP
jgi:predicted RNA-binding Zn-ribbon protein involved in translation (DUF1610 family)